MLSSFNSDKHYIIWTWLKFNSYTEKILLCCFSFRYRHFSTLWFLCIFFCFVLDYPLFVENGNSDYRNFTKQIKFYATKPSKCWNVSMYSIRILECVTYSHTLTPTFFSVFGADPVFTHRHRISISTPAFFTVSVWSKIVLFYFSAVFK